MTDIRIDRPEEPKTQTKKYYKSKYCVSLHLPKELEEKVKNAAESEARNVTSYITSLIVNYSATSYRASCFTHYCIGRDVTQLNVLRNVHRRISLGYSIPTVYVLFMLLH